MNSSNPININKLFFCLAICLLPFNGLPYFQDLFRELSSEGAFYPLLILTLIWLFKSIKNGFFAVPDHATSYLLMIFFIWIIISSAMNVLNILSVTFKGRSGIERSIFQILLFAFVMSTAYASYFIIRSGRISLYDIRNYFKYSFVLIVFYSIAELAYLYTNNELASQILLLISEFIRDENMPQLYGRVRSVSAEASWFANYCSLLFPWLMSFIFTERKRFVGYIYVTYLLMLLILTWSRTAYLITIMQILVYSLLIIRFGFKKEILILSKFLLILIGLFLIASITFVGLIDGYDNIMDVIASVGSTENLSNVARIGSQIAAIKMGVDNPVFGVGFGQYGFYVNDYLPVWAYVSLEIQEWTSNAVGTKWPPVHGIYSRIFGETGVIGLSLWIALWWSLFKACFEKIHKQSKSNNTPDILGIALLVSAIGVFLSGFNVDSFRMFSYWLTFAICWSYIKK